MRGIEGTWKKRPKPARLFELALYILVDGFLKLLDELVVAEDVLDAILNQALVEEALDARILLQDNRKRLITRPL